MNRTIPSLSVSVLIATLALGGCKSSESSEDYAPPTPPTAMRTLPATTGFLSTYSRLEQAGPSSLRYVDPNNRLARYDKFMIQPVEILWYEQGVVVSDSNQRMLADEMRKALVNALSDRYEIVSGPDSDVGEIRVALTDLKRSTPILNALPRLKFAEFGLGGLAMEAEIIDSESNVQIGALVESSVGRNLSWNPSDFDDAIGAMQDWAGRFRRAVDAAHAAGDR